MANRTLRGPTPARFFSDQRYRLTWLKLDEGGLPENYKTHYVAYHDGRPRGEMFWGKIERWWCIVYGGPTFCCRDGHYGALHMVSVICGGPAS